MVKSRPSPVTVDPWQELQQFTEARIALGRSGVSLPLQQSLKFRLAHARARDAVHKPVDAKAVAKALEGFAPDIISLKSRVRDRFEYLTRPDLGRFLDSASKDVLKKMETGFDLCICICDGLSAPAVSQSAGQVCRGLLEILATTTLCPSPIFLVENGRVAIADEICESLGAKMVITLIGERPGLSSPNSLGAYLTYKPVVGTTDEARNCISNIRKGGMSIAAAVQKIAYLVESAMRLGKSGVVLKDKMASDYTPLLSFKI